LDKRSYSEAQQDTGYWILGSLGILFCLLIGVGVLMSKIMLIIPKNYEIKQQAVSPIADLPDNSGSSARFDKHPESSIMSVQLLCNVASDSDSPRRFDDWC
jgi:hypothetical protein